MLFLAFRAEINISTKDVLTCHGMTAAGAGLTLQMTAHGTDHATARAEALGLARRLTEEVPVVSMAWSLDCPPWDAIEKLVAV